MKPLRRLEFDTLPLIDRKDIFIRLDRSIEEQFNKLEFLAETYERARSALMFFFQTMEEKDYWRNDARLRAGLNEFYSMEDAARRDFRRANVGGEPAKIALSQSPLVHMMYILRHVNVHTRPLPSKVEVVTVLSEFGGAEHEYSYSAVMIEPISVDDLYRCRELKNYYDQNDLERALAWLLSEQQTFGVSEVFRAGVNIYCRELLSSLEIDK